MFTGAGRFQSTHPTRVDFVTAINSLAVGNGGGNEVGRERREKREGKGSREFQSAVNFGLSPGLELELFMRSFARTLSSLLFFPSSSLWLPLCLPLCFALLLLSCVFRDPNKLLIINWRKYAIIVAVASSTTSAAAASLATPPLPSSPPSLLLLLLLLYFCSA